MTVQFDISVITFSNKHAQQLKLPQVLLFYNKDWGQHFKKITVKFLMELPNFQADRGERKQKVSELWKLTALVNLEISLVTECTHASWKTPLWLLIYSQLLLIESDGFQQTRLHTTSSHFHPRGPRPSLISWFSSLTFKEIIQLLWCHTH